MGERPDEISGFERGDAETIDQGGTVGASMESTSDGPDDTAEIRSDIEQTRSEMSETIDAIQERLSPQRLKEQAKEQVREATIGRAEEAMRNAGDTLNEARYGLMETIRHNPVPAALAGIGLGWLWMNRRSGGRPRYQGYYDRSNRYDGARGYPGATYGYQSGGRQDDPSLLERGGQAVSRAQETVGDAVDKAQSAVGDVAHQAQDAASAIADQAQYQAQRFEDRFERTLHENPLAVGAVALALGTAVGFTLPQTERENQLLGETRDNLLERAETVAQDTFDKVQHVASDVLDETKATVHESAREQGLTGQEKERGM